MNTPPQISTAEIADWENRFRQSVSTQVKFDVEQDGNSTMKLYNGDSGVEAIWSGVIILNNDNSIKWRFSMQNGAIIQAVLNLNEQNFQIISNLYHFYENWKQEWSKQMTIPDDASYGDVTMQPSGAVQGGQVTPAAAASMTENKRSKTTILRDSRERMLRLAGNLNKR